MRKHFPLGVIKDQRIEWNEPLGRVQIKRQSFSKNLNKAQFAVDENKKEIKEL